MPVGTGISCSSTAGDAESALRQAAAAAAAETMGAMMRDGAGMSSNEPNYGVMGRELMARSSEDYNTGLYGTIGRLSGRDIMEQANLAGAGSNIARPGPRSAMVTFIGGELRPVHGVGRGMQEEAMTSLEPISVRRDARTETGDGGEGGRSWHHQANPPGSTGIMHRVLEGQDQPLLPGAMAAAPSSFSDQRHPAPSSSSGQPLALVRVDTVRAVTSTELMQGHQRAFEQQQHHDFMLRQRSAAVPGPASGTSGSMACQDCGNQAKKDCMHSRCRTCCKSRGFDCPTHVKSTWVPVSKRRQRLQQAGLLNMASGGSLHMQLTKIKRPRMLTFAAPPPAPVDGGGGGIGGASSIAGDQGGGVGGAPSHASTSTGTPPRSSDMNSGAAGMSLPQEGQPSGVFPPEIRMQAAFRCVRLLGLMDEHEEYAYQTEIKVGGHIFKGILHDQGPDKFHFGTASLSELQLGGRPMQPSSGVMDLPVMYGSAGGDTILGAFR